MIQRAFFATLIVCLGACAGADGPPSPTRVPRVRAVDLDVGELVEVELCDGSKARVKLLALEESRDAIRSAVRKAVARVEINGQVADLTSATYHLPLLVGGVQVDCPITRGYMTNTDQDHWGLVKAARLRFWPAGSRWIEPGTFVYPARQRWFASATQMANEPTYVDGVEQPSRRKIYYHSGLDIGGAEGMVAVLAATAGLVVSLGTSTLPGYEKTPVAPRYDVVYILDDRGWYYRYSHLQSFDPAIRAGCSRNARPEDRAAGKGRRQWRLVAPSLRDRQSPAIGAMGHAGGLCVPVGGVSAAVPAPDHRGREAAHSHLYERADHPRRLAVVESLRGAFAI